MTTRRYSVTVYEYVLKMHVIVASGASPTHAGTKAMAEAMGTPPDSGPPAFINRRFELGGLAPIDEPLPGSRNEDA